MRPPKVELRGVICPAVRRPDLVTPSVALRLTFVLAGGSAPAVYAAQTPPILIAVPVAGIAVTIDASCSDL